MTKLGPLPPVAGVCKVEYSGNLGGIPYANLFHIAYSGPPPDQNAIDSLAGKMQNGWSVEFVPVVNTSLVIQSTTVTDLSSNTGVIGVNNTVMPGSRAGQVGPNNCATVLSWAISRRYRGGHPRSYLGGINAADMTSAIDIDPTYTALVQSAAAAFLSSAKNPGGVPMTLTGLVCVHYRKGAAYLVPPLVDPITAVVAKVQIGTQRRRLS